MFYSIILHVLFYYSTVNLLLCVLCTDKDGDTLLHRVCAANMEGLVEVLLKNGANPNIANHKGQTPVHFSAREGQVFENLSLIYILNRS